MPDAWVEVVCTVPADLSDQLAELLIELSGAGVCIDNQTVDTFSIDSIPAAAQVTIRSYFPDNTDIHHQIVLVEELLAELSRHSGFTPSPPSVSIINQEDWATSWKQHFHPTPIGRRLLLKPSWEEVTESDETIIIEIDPGMAFGTGTHATTRLCLETLEKAFDAIPPFIEPLPAEPAVLDVGTGSGVLAIAARKLGAGRIVATDIDPDAVQVAKLNLAMNGIHNEIDVSTTSLAVIGEKFSIVLANILAEDLIRMAEDLSERLLPQGLLILSGILIEREDSVREAYTGYDLSLVEITHQQEWSCLVYRRGC
jgi:ribosomal protein L11 methyltransferase